MIWYYPLLMLRNLILTILIEGIGALIFKCRKKDLLVVTLVNVLTNPCVNALPFLCLFVWGREAAICMLAALEILTVFVEGFVYSKWFDDKKRAYLMSFLLNLTSYGIGEIMNRCLRA